MEKEILERLNAQDELLQKIYKSAEKTRKYFLWTIIGSLAMFILPLIGLAFVIPAFLNQMTSQYQGLL